MKRFLIFVKKEFFHILRDRRSLFVLFGIPITQIILFGFALTNEVKNSKIAILDHSKDLASQAIIQSLESSNYFDIEINIKSEKEIYANFKKGKFKLLIIFPQNFRETLLHTNKAHVQLIADATDPNIATTLTNYISGIIMSYQQELIQYKNLPYQIKVETRMLYNPQLKGAYNFVPGVMGMILILVSAMMTSIAIVKEKELGTMEILLVSPLQAWVIVITKMIPYLVLSLVNVLSILILSVYVLGLPIAGSVFLLLAVSMLYIICALAMGLLISTLTNSQQSAMLFSLMGLMMPVIMLSGYVFPTENMPIPLQIISNLIPTKWYIIMVKNVMLKGLSIGSIWKEVLILSFMTTFFIGLSIKRFKIRLE